MREHTIKIYEFDELSREAKDVAVQGFADINLQHEWWDGVFEDAAGIGLVITEFNIDRGAHCHGEFLPGAEAVADLILENHGESCETHKDATSFLADLDKAKTVFESKDGCDEEFTDSDEYDELCEEFLKMIREDYRIMLQKEYEHLGSKEAIIETIEANEYEFTEDGKPYSG